MTSLTPTGRKGRRLLRIGSWLTLLLVVLPNVLYVGHSALGFLDPGSGHVDLHDPAQVEEHATHCHLGPSKCTTQYAAVSLSLTDGNAWAIDAGGRLLRADTPYVTTFGDAHVSRLTPPPRFA